VSVGFVPLFFYEILKTVGFVSIRDFNDSRFCSFKKVQEWSVLLGHGVSMMVGFQHQSALFGYEISMMVDFCPLRNFNNGQFCWVTRFQ